MDTTVALEAMRQYYDSGATRSYAFRKEQLLRLKASVIKYEKEIFEALHTDLRKSPEECWITENGFLLSELKSSIRNLKERMEPQPVGTNLLNFPSKSYILSDPLGVVLIIGPWNYPMQLLFTPLVGAISAGNCVVLKPSELAPATAAIMKTIIEETFDKKYILYVEGDGAEVVPQMMNSFVFDHVFYTGSTAVGKIIYGLAAKDLVPVTLELGGKSPCIVEEDADIKTAARRITMTKFSNAGQMCVAPDYVLVHASVKEKLVEELKKCIRAFFGDDAQQSDYYGRIINERQFLRLEKYLTNGKLLAGGKTDKADLFIEPSLLEINNADEPVMQDEIFGPILPLIVFTEMKEAMNVIKKHPNPLAMYVFTSSKEKEKTWLQSVPFGGGCINNASFHLTNHHLPFGGRGTSGLGNYHGKFSFDTFSHKKAIMKTPTWIDPSLKYPPFKGRLNLFKKITG